MKMTRDKMWVLVDCILEMNEVEPDEPWTEDDIDYLIECFFNDWTKIDPQDSRTWPPNKIETGTTFFRRITEDKLSK